MVYRTRSTRYEPAIHKAHHTGVPLRFPMVYDSPDRSTSVANLESMSAVFRGPDGQIGRGRMGECGSGERK